MSPKSGIVIPCYNEGPRIDLESFRSFVSENDAYHICFVNDGSTDNTAMVLKNFCESNPDRFSLMNLAVNSGKGEAIRTGLLELKSWNEFESLGFLDADLATPLSEYKKLNIILMSASYEAVFGSRLKKVNSQITRSLKRHLIGRVFANLISTLLKLPFYDTQCGAKVFKTEFLDQIIETEFLTKWLFDVEILLRLKRKTGNADVFALILEKPLDKWIEKGDSKITKADIVQIPVDLLKIKKYYK